MSLTHVRQRESAEAHDQVRLLANAVSLLTANRSLASGSISIGSDGVSLRTGATVPYTVDGVFASLAATDNLWTPRGPTVAPNQVQKYLLCVDANGQPVVAIGTPTTTADRVVLPGPSQALAIIGVAVVATGPTTSFVPGTTALGAMGVTTTIYNGFDRSLLPLTSPGGSIDASSSVEPDAVSTPNAPTVGSVSVSSPSTLTYPVTADTAGGIPATVFAEVDEAGTGTWVAQTAVAWTGGLGDTQSVQVTGLTASTDYTGKIRFRLGNAAGSSDASDPVSDGTTAASSPAINTTTGQYIGDSNGAIPSAFDWFDRYADDAEFRTKIAHYGSNTPADTLSTYDDPTKWGTAPDNSSALYGDGRWPDLCEISASVTSAIDGAKMLDVRIVGANNGASSPTPNLSIGLPYHHAHVWLWRRWRAKAPFTQVGDADSTDGIAFNNGTSPYSSAQNPAFKESMAVNYPNGWSSRGAYEVANGTGKTVDLSFTVNYGAGAVGIAETNIGTYTTQYSDDLEYDTLIQFTIDGANLTATVWQKKASDPNSSFAKIGDTLTGNTGANPTASIASVSVLCLNYNQSRATDLHCYTPGWAVFDGANPNADGSDDPFGVLGSPAVAAPDAPTATDATDQSSTTLTFPVTTAATGDAATSIVVEQDISGTWTEIDDVSCTVPQGSPQNVVVTGLTADTAYPSAFRFKGRNSGGDSAASSTVSGTTTPASSLPSLPTETNLVQRIISLAGTDTTTDTQPVGEWDDQSANATAYTQSTGTSKPTYVASSQNSLPGIAFDSGDWLQAAAALAALNVKYWTMYVIAKPNGGTGTDRRIFSNEDQANFAGYATGLDNNDHWAVWYGTGAANSKVVGSLADSSAHQLCLIYDDDGTNIVSNVKIGIYVDGVGIDGLANSYVPQSTQPPAVGTRSDSPGTANGTAVVYEILLFASNTDHSAAHVDATRQTFFAYAASEWGVPDNS